MRIAHVCVNIKKENQKVNCFFVVVFCLFVCFCFCFFVSWGLFCGRWWGCTYYVNSNSGIWSEFYQNWRNVDYNNGQPYLRLKVLLLLLQFVRWYGNFSDVIGNLLLLLLLLLLFLLRFCFCLFPFFKGGIFLNLYFELWGHDVTELLVLLSDRYTINRQRKYTHTHTHIYIYIYIYSRAIQ